MIKNEMSFLAIVEHRNWRITHCDESFSSELNLFVNEFLPVALRPPYTHEDGGSYICKIFSRDFDVSFRHLVFDGSDAFLLLFSERSLNKFDDPIFEKSATPEIVVDSSGRIVAANVSFRDLFGTPPDSYSSLPFASSDYSGVFVSAVANAISGQETSPVFLSLLSRVGERELLCYISHLSENNGAFLFFADVTDVLRAGENLSYLYQALEQSPVAIVVTNPVGTIEYVNSSFCLLTGFSKEESVGKKAGFQKSGKTPSETYSGLFEAMAERRPWNGEFLNRRKDGTIGVDLARISPIFDVNGKVSKFVAVLEDVTVRRNLERKLFVTNERIEGIVAERTKNLGERLSESETIAKNRAELLLVFAEDVVSAVSEMLAVDSRISNKTSSVSNDERRRLLKIGEEMRDFALIESGRFSVESVPVSIDELFSKLRGGIASLRNTSVAVHFKISTEFPRWFVSDPARCFQIVAGLLENSLERSPSDGEIFVEANVAGKTLELSMEDSGAFFGSECAASLDMSAPISLRGGKLCKMGVAVLRKIAESLGGTLACRRSEKHGGVRFSFTLPLFPALPNVPLSSLSPVESVRALHAGKQVLLIDSDELSLGLLVGIFDGLGITVELAFSVEEALSLISQTDYPLIFLSEQNTFEDTSQLCDAIRNVSKNPESLKICLVGPPMIPAVLDEKVSSALGKPVDPDKLYKTLLSELSPEKHSVPFEGRTSEDAKLVDALSEIPELDLAFALSSMRKPEIVLRILNTFVDHHENAGNRIISLNHLGKTDDAAKSAHALKGAASSVGFLRLAEFISDIEQGILRGEDVSSYTSQLESILSSIGEAFRQHLSRFVGASK